MVGIGDAGRVLRSYPHQLSGGMCQRVTIATALANDPGLLILDEPTTALDTTIQAQILDIIADLKTRLETAIVFVSHDISVVTQICDELVVMYGGRVMESGRTEQVIGSPKHPYTQGLISAAMSVSSGTGRLESIPGEVPDPQRMPSGCPFRPRCPHAMPQCATDPPLSTLADGRQVACWLHGTYGGRGGDAAMRRCGRMTVGHCSRPRTCGSRSIPGGSAAVACTSCAPWTMCR